MTYSKTVLIRSLLLSTEAIIAYSLVGILWELLCGRPPLSLPIYLGAGAAVIAVNVCFLQKPRTSGKLFLLNLILGALWIPLLCITVDRTYPQILLFPLSLFVIPLIRGYQHSIFPLTASKVQMYAEVTQIFTLLYLIVASFLPGLLRSLPALLIVLVLELWALIQFRTSAPNTVRAGGTLNRRAGILLPLLFTGFAAGMTWLLFRFREELQPILDVLRTVIDTALILLWKFMTMLVSNRTAQAEELLNSENGSLTDPEALISGQFNFGTKIIFAVFILLIAALLLFAMGALLYWIRKQFRNTHQSDAFWANSFITPAKHVTLLEKLYLRIRIWSYCQKHKGSPQAALLRLEQLGRKNHCGRMSGETPRQFLQRLQTHLSALPQEQQTLFLCLQDDIDGAIYGRTAPQLSRETVCSLLSEIKGALQS